MSTVPSDSNRIAAAAQAIAKARLANTPLDTLPEAIRPRDLAEGYRVQDALHALLTQSGRGAIVGHKIGATTPVMQQYMRIDHPCAGGIFASTVYESGIALPARHFVKVGIECEVAARLGQDMPPEDAPYNRNSVAPYVDAYMAAIELVDDRYTDWPSMGTPSLAADDFFGAGSVLGPAVLPRKTPDLVTIAGRASLNGKEVASGHGADVMGHPLEALAWLANHFAQRGTTLRAGQFVSTGSLVKTLWLTPGDHVAIDVEGLGRVDFTSSKA